MPCKSMTYKALVVAEAGDKFPPPADHPTRIKRLSDAETGKMDDHVAGRVDVLAAPILLLICYSSGYAQTQEECR